MVQIVPRCILDGVILAKCGYMHQLLEQLASDWRAAVYQDELRFTCRGTEQRDVDVSNPSDFLEI